VGRLEGKVAVVTGAGRGIGRATPDDTTELGAARALVARTVDEFVSLDIPVNNAGATRDRTFHNLDDEPWDLVLDTNVRTPFHATLAAVGHMRESAKRETAERGTPGHHRNFTFATFSVALVGNPGQANYTAAKGALIGLTRTLAQELGMPEEFRQMMVFALGRYGRPEEDLADAHVFLAPSEADDVTGAILPVTGGQLGIRAR
jgi:NAD(P)-dependent dehydrogenase (short-subunit alcohol dehydrogenase family)